MTPCLKGMNREMEMFLNGRADIQMQDNVAEFNKRIFDSVSVNGKSG